MAAGMNERGASFREAGSSRAPSTLSKYHLCDSAAAWLPGAPHPLLEARAEPFLTPPPAVGVFLGRRMGPKSKQPSNRPVGFQTKQHRLARTRRVPMKGLASLSGTSLNVSAGTLSNSVERSASVRLYEMHSLHHLVYPHINPVKCLTAVRKEVGFNLQAHGAVLDTGRFRCLKGSCLGAWRVKRRVSLQPWQEHERV